MSSVVYNLFFLRIFRKSYRNNKRIYYLDIYVLLFELLYIKMITIFLKIYHPQNQEKANQQSQLTNSL